MSGSKQLDLDDFLISGAIDGYYDYGGRLPLQDLPPKCECGASVTMGKDDMEIFHSSWCPVTEYYLKKKKELA